MFRVFPQKLGHFLNDPTNLVDTPFSLRVKTRFIVKKTFHDSHSEVNETIDYVCSGTERTLRKSLSFPHVAAKIYFPSSSSPDWSIIASRDLG